MPVFSGTFVFSDVRIRERKSGFGIPYMDFDQNQEFGHFGKVTPPWPPQRGRVPEMPTVVRFGAENPLFSGKNCFQMSEFSELD